MIKINLLPVKEDKLKNVGRDFLFIAGAVVVALVIAVVFHNSILAQNESARKSKIEKLDRDIMKLKAHIREINKLKKKKKELEEKIKMIVKLQDDNIGPVRVLDELSLKMPTSKIWIDDLTLSKDRVVMNGKTLENQEVASFMKQLEKSMFFSGVELKRIQKERVIKGIPTLKYSLASKVYLIGKRSAAGKEDAGDKKSQSDKTKDAGEEQ